MIIVTFYLVYLLATQISEWRAWITGGAFSLLGAAMTLIPIPLEMAGRLDAFSKHATGRLIFNNWEWVASTHHTSALIGILIGQLKANLLYFFTGHDFGPFYLPSTPILAVVLGPLVALGLLLMILRVRDSRYAMLALWFWTVLFIGGVLTIDSPQSHRLLPAALPALAGIALVLNELMDVSTNILPERFAQTFLPIPVILIITFAGYSDNLNYFRTAIESTQWESDTIHGKYIASLGSGYRVYSLAAPNVYADSSVTRFLAPDVEVANLANPGLKLPLAVPPNKDLAFFHCFPPNVALSPSTLFLVSLRKEGGGNGSGRPGSFHRATGPKVSNIMLARIVCQLPRSYLDCN